MDRHPSLSDDVALEREIAQALAVDPSPEFLPRVRARIASEATPAAWRLRWTWVAAGALAAVIVLAVVLAPSNRSETFEVASRPVLDARTFANLPVPMPSSDRRVLRLTPVVSGFSRTKPSRTEPSRTESGRTESGTEPEILIDPAETRALRRLIAGARDGTIDLSTALQATEPTPMDLPPVRPITIPPITIDPLAPSGEEGAPQ